MALDRVREWDCDDGCLVEKVLFGLTHVHTHTHVTKTHT